MQVHVEKRGSRLFLMEDGCVFLEVCYALFNKSLLSLPTFSSSKDFLQWFDEIEYKVGKRYAIWLLGRQAYHSRKLKDKLLEKGISLSTAQRIVKECIQSAYVKDEEYLESFIRSQVKKGKGPGAILANIKGKGFFQKDEDILIKKALPVKLQKEILQKQILKLQKKGYSREKMMRSLQRKGFSMNLIIESIKLYAEGR